MRIYITGVSGFVGGCLARHLLDAGHQVSGSGSAAASRQRAPRGLARFDVLALGQEPPAGTFGDLDAIVHAAYTAASDSEALNVTGTISWSEAFHRDSDGSQLFISSHSAGPDAPSEYGRQKHQLESFFLEHGHRIARPGLVIGYGGLFKRMMDLVWKLPALPLLDGGKAMTPVTAPGDLALAARHLLDGLEAPSSVNLFNRQSLRLVDLLVALKRTLGRRTFLVPIPSVALLPPLWLAHRLGIPLPVDIENVRGYRAVDGHGRESDYPSLLPHETPLESMLEDAATALREDRERSRR